MVASLSTIESFEAFAVTETASRGTTPTMEKREPEGFQHLEQPQAWLWATLLFKVISTWSEAQRQWSFPPEKLLEPGVMPLSIRGWREGAMVRNGK